LEFDILERVWSGKDVSYSHLKVFRCKAFAHVPKGQRLKLDSKATPCIFVGYRDAEFGYKLWDPEKKKMIRSRDVVFYENKNLANLEKTKKTKDAIVGVPDLTPAYSSSNHVTTREEVQDENLGDEPIAVDGDETARVDCNDAQDIEDVEQGEHPIPPEMEEPQVRRSTREHRPLTKYPSSEYILLTDEGESECFQEVESHEDKQSWMKVM